MSRITVHRRVRPIRFAFLVDPSDEEGIRSTIQLNTILWGGKYNAIIPLSDVPAKLTSATISRTEFIKGNIEAFDPDFVVTVGAVDVSELALSPKRLRTIEDVNPSRGGLLIGMTVMPAYQQRYQAVYQFVRRDPVPMVVPENVGDEAELLLAACFGEFSPVRAKGFQTAYKDIGGVSLRIDAANYLDTLGHSMTPLRASVLHVEPCRKYGNPLGVMLLDPKSAVDLLDYWNLRALGWPVIPVPIDWAEGIAQGIRSIVVDRARELHLYNLLIRRTTFFAGGTVSDSALSDWMTRSVGVGLDVAFATETPRFWNAETRKVDRSRRLDVSAGEEALEVEAEGERINFDLKAPPFPFDQRGACSAFANVVFLASKDLFDVAGVIPTETDELDGLLVPMSSPEFLRNGEEGLVCFGTADRDYVSWRVPRGIHVFQEWLKGQGEVAHSGAGKIGRRMIEILGGPDGCHLVTNPELMQLLEGAVGKSTIDITHRELLAVALRKSRNSKEVAARWIQALVNRQVLRLGMRLSCPNCAQSNWYSIDELRDMLVCRRCLDGFQFPSAMPPERPEWSYRPMGPFAIEGQAQGAYVVASAINALKNLNFANRSTWTTSFELKKPGGGKFEVDFALLLQGESWDEVRATVVLGECKTFGDIQANDVRRMAEIGAMFPGSVLAFATMKDVFSDEEKVLLRDLAVAGREHWKHGVLALTSLELSERHHFPYCWRHSGDTLQRRVYDELIQPHYHCLRQVCDASQQIHLGMPPDNAWPHEDDSYRREFEDGDDTN